MKVLEIAEFLPQDAAYMLRKPHVQESVTEIRIRADKPVQFRYSGGECFSESIVNAENVRKTAVRMMDYSYYMREDELAKGYFTMQNGCRVGVCGTYGAGRGGGYFLKEIGSLCIRIAREFPGCAAQLFPLLMESVGCRSTLILSKPGMGKTTIIRDAARMLSNAGCMVGICDERHEIAACIDGVPSFDVGERTDVVDGAPKHAAMEHLVRSMSPQWVIADEIGSGADLDALRFAAYRGVSVLASAHAGSFEEAEAGPAGVLIREGLFGASVLMDGEPGRIAGVRKYPAGGKK